MKTVTEASMAIIAKVLAELCGDAVLEIDKNHIQQGVHVAHVVLDNRDWPSQRSRTFGGDYIGLELARRGPPGWDDGFSLHALTEVCEACHLDLIEADGFLGVRGVVSTAWDYGGIGERVDTNAARGKRALGRCRKTDLNGQRLGPRRLRHRGVAGIQL